MKISVLSRFVCSLLTFSSFLTIGGSLAHSEPVPFSVSFYYPTNGQTFAAPATTGLYTRVTDSNLVYTMQFYANSTSLGIATNTQNVLLTNASSVSPLELYWTNISAGTYTLTAVATDSAGLMAASAPVNITVTNPPPPHPSVYIYSPTNNTTYVAPANVNIYARAVEENTGTVATVEFFAGSLSLGVVSNSSQVVVSNISTAPVFPLNWPNVPVGNYNVRAVATDALGNAATSSVVVIKVVTNLPPPPPLPFVVSFWYPTNGQTFIAPANIGVHALVVDSNVVQTVEYFVGDKSLGIVSNTTGVILTNTTQGNPFFLSWSNVTAGTYALRAVATDSAGLMATSAPVNITVTNLPPPHPSVYIYSPTNNTTYVAPANVNIYARAAEGSTGIVATVAFFAGSTSLGVVSNSSQVVVSNISTAPVFPLNWPGVPVGNYELHVVATDALGNSATSTVVVIKVVTNLPPPPPVPFIVSMWYPTNGQTFVAPATIGVHALVVDSNVVRTVQYFAGDTSIGIVTNTGGVLLTNTTSDNPFFLSWSNVTTGSYTLTAVATDSAGLMVTSAPVNITVTNPPPPHPSVYIYAPTNNTTYVAPANVNIYARAVEENTGTVATVEFFAGGLSLGVVSNSSQIIVSNISTAPVFPLNWPNVPVGNYELRAVATDALGNSATSSVVNISVVTNLPPPPPVPFAISLAYPTNHQVFSPAPANIYVHAIVVDSNVVRTVQFFAGDTSIAIFTNTSNVPITNTTSSSNPFYIVWSNVLAGTYTLHAVATDTAGFTATSPPVSIVVVTNSTPVAVIYAPDPVAIRGTNFCCIDTTPTNTSYYGGSNTATFLVSRDEGTNTDLTVYYSISGTASNGVDYAAIPDHVTIPAGQRYARIIIIPLEGDNPTNLDDKTVVLTLIMPPLPPNTPPPYSLGSPQNAGAVIRPEDATAITQPMVRNLPDHSLYVSLPGTNGMNFSLQVSTDMVNWVPLCTNTVLKGSAQFVDPNATNNLNLLYRVVPVAAPPAY